MGKDTIRIRASRPGLVTASAHGPSVRPTLASIPAIVLAGGLGRRLRCRVSDRPKVLAPVAGRPFLMRLLDRLAAHGSREVVLCTGHLAEQIESALGTHYRGMKIRHSREHEPLGTAGAVRAAAAQLHSDRVLVLNGDSCCDTDLTAFQTWAARGRPAALLAAEVADVGRFGTLDIDDHGRVRAFREKGDTGAGWINAGIYLFDRALVLDWPRLWPLSLERDVLPRMLDQLHARTCRGAFLDIGTPSSYDAAAAFFAADDSRTPAPGLVLLDRDGTVIVERAYLSQPKHVRLLPGAATGLGNLQAAGYRLAIATNQSGIGRGYFAPSDLMAVHARLTALLQAEGIELDGIWHCPHAPASACTCRKPRTGMLDAAATALGFSAKSCLMVGDQDCDLAAGRAAGLRTCLVCTGQGRHTEEAGRTRPDLVVEDLAELAEIELSRIGHTLTRGSRTP